MMNRKMQLPLLVSVLALLTNQTTIGTTLTRQFDTNLNHIIDLVEKVDGTLAKDNFVSDVQNLYDAGCKDDFFCKVHQTLKHPKAFEEVKGLQEIVMNLEKFINGTKVSCPLGKPSDVTKPLPDLLKLLTGCIQKRNFNRGSLTKPNDRNATS